MNKFSKLATSIVFGAMSFSIAGQAAAQSAPVTNPTVPVAQFSTSNIGPILTELGAVWQEGEANGQRYIAVNADGQLNFLLAPTACRGANNTDCVGLSMTALFEGQANPQSVSAFNYRFAFCSAGLDPDGGAYLNRYEIADYGMARGNLAVSILVFIEQAKLFQNELSTARRTVALDGYADDLSSRSLNRTALKSFTGGELHLRGAVDSHQVGLDEAARQIKLFLKTDNAPRNKISNIAK